MKVHIGHSSASGGMCGTGSMRDGDRDITVSEWAFFHEIASRHQCRHCVKIHFPHGGNLRYHGERSDKTLDRSQ